METRDKTANASSPNTDSTESDALLGL